MVIIIILNLKDGFTRTCFETSSNNQTQRKTVNKVKIAILKKLEDQISHNKLQ
jgi:hypothetical protein